MKKFLSILVFTSFYLIAGAQINIESIATNWQEELQKARMYSHNMAFKNGSKGMTDTLDYIINEVYSSTGGLSYTEKTQYYYGIEGNILEVNSRINTTGAHPYNKIEIQYDSLGIHKANVYYTYDAVQSNYDLRSKTEYTYSNSGKLTSETPYQWNGNQWNMPNLQYRYNYTSFDEVSELIVSISDGINLIPGLKAYYLYSNAQQLIEYGIANIDTNNHWNSSSKKGLVYNSAGKLIKIVDSTRITTNQYIQSSCIDYYLSFNQILDSAISMSWDNTASNWIYSGKGIYFRNSNDDLTRLNTYDYDPIDSIWNLTSFSTAKFTSIEFGNVILPFYKPSLHWANDYAFPSQKFDINMAPYEYANFVDVLYQPTQKTTYYYKGLHTAVDQAIKPNSIKIYPNPSNSYINLELTEDYESAIGNIYDMKGTLIKSITFKNNTQIDVSNLEAGVYLVSIQINGQEISKTIVIE